jgi:hypothetical protein
VTREIDLKYAYKNIGYFPEGQVRE